MGRLFIVLGLFCFKAMNAQQGFTYNIVPLQKEVSIKILGCDRQVLQYYNLYGYNYISSADTLYGEFIVMKDADTFRGKEETKIKFCRPREFSLLTPDGKCLAMKVENGIELIYKDKEEKVYLNFDPSLPDAIFIPCK